MRSQHNLRKNIRFLDFTRKSFRLHTKISRLHTKIGNLIKKQIYDLSGIRGIPEDTSRKQNNRKMHPETSIPTQNKVIGHRDVKSREKLSILYFLYYSKDRSSRGLTILLFNDTTRD